MPIRRQAIIWTHPLEILVSLVHALQDIATNGNDVLCVSFKVEFT